MTSWDKVEKDVDSGPFGLFKWVAIAVILAVVLFGGIRLFMLPASTAIERVVMKNSFQYQEGMAQRGAILEANLAEIDLMLIQAPDNAEALMAQQRAIRAQLRAITINQ